MTTIHHSKNKMKMKILLRTLGQFLTPNLSLSDPYLISLLYIKTPSLTTHFLLYQVDYAGNSTRHHPFIYLVDAIFCNRLMYLTSMRL